MHVKGLYIRKVFYVKLNYKESHTKIIYFGDVYEFLHAFFACKILSLAN